MPAAPSRTPSSTPTSHAGNAGSAAGYGPRGGANGCVIGPRITVRGSLSGEEDLVVEGRIEGRVTLIGHLVVAPDGIVEADVDASSVEVRGTVRGDIVATRSITIERGARVAGNVRAPRVMIHDGAHFDGAVEMDVALPDGLGRTR